MNILYINTSGKYCEIALFDGNGIVTHQVHESTMSHSTVLHTMIENLMIDTKLSFQDLNGIGVMNGPGSYTGLRIGLSVAKSFCYILNVPLLLLNKLEIGCDYYQEQHPQQDGVACIQFAREGEYFLAIKRNQEFLTPTAVYTNEEVMNLLNLYNISTLVNIDKTDTIELEKEAFNIDLSLKYISKTLLNMLHNNNLSNIYSSEPFYLKKVHVNVAKKRF